MPARLAQHAATPAWQLRPACAVTRWRQRRNRPLAPRSSANLTDAEFAATAESFDNPDYPAVTLHSYRHRHGNAPDDPRYGRPAYSNAPQMPTGPVMSPEYQVFCVPTTTGVPQPLTGGKLARKP